MNIGSVFRPSKGTMRRKLMGYMLLLALLLMLALLTGLFMFGRYTSAEKDAYEALDVQMEVFRRDVETHFDRIAAAGIRLSEDVSGIVDAHLRQQGILFDGLSDDNDAIAAMQEALIEPLRQTLLQEHCSGVFVVLDATVNRSLPDANYSRTGLYLKQTGYDNSDEDILLFRGISGTGKAHGIMPHRKWRLEFLTDLIPDYAAMVSADSTPLEQAYRFTDVFVLPGTSERVMLLCVPVYDASGHCIGLCGYEISESHFITYHAQPTKFEYLTCMLLPGNEQVLDPSAGLSCGGFNGYYRAPNESLAARSIGNGLTCFQGEDVSYVGLTQPISLSPCNADYSLAVMMLKTDFDNAVSKSNLQNAILWMLLLFFAVSCCLYFSRRFLSPILRALEQIKSDDRDDAESDVTEIDDLFAFLAEKDQEHANTVRTLKEETRHVRREQEKLLSQYESAQAEISRLAYSRKQEVDPDDYQRFLAGIDMLTPTESRIFGYYLDGKTVKEIIEIAQIKESTLRYHNQNIYGKLGVNSLKQLLRYAALMQSAAGQQDNR